MVNEQFKYLMTPEQKLPVAVRIAAWIGYGVFGLISTAFVALMTLSFWASLAWIALLVFGPKLFRKLG